VCVIIKTGEADLSLLFKKSVVVYSVTRIIKPELVKLIPSKHLKHLCKNPSVLPQEKKKNAMMTTAGVFDSQPCTVEMTENKGRAFYIVNTAIKMVYNIKDFRLKQIMTSL